MSSYLNFYLLPKKSKKSYTYTENGGNIEEEIKLTEGKPLLFDSYSRSDDVYQSFNDTLNIAYAGDEEKYTDVTLDDVKRVIDNFEVDIDKTKKRLEVNYKMLKEGGYHGELYVDIQSSEEYLQTQTDTLKRLRYIQYLVSVCTDSICGDFEKVVANID